MSKRNIIILIVVGIVGGIFALCLVCGLVGMLADSNPPDRVVIATLAPLESAPTVTPIPEEPTAIPESPTSTPAPTATPMPVASDDMVAYVEIVSKNTSALAEALSGMSNLMLEPDLFNEGWKIDVRVQLGSIHTAHQNLAEATVPAGVEVFHSRLIDATADCDAMTEHLSAALDDFDDTKILLATTLMQSCSQKIVDLTDEVNSLKN